MPLNRQLGALNCLDFRTVISFYLALLHINFCYGWLPDTSTKLSNSYKQIQSITFKGSGSHPDNFIVLHQDEYSVLLGGRNRIYSLSLNDLSESKDMTIEWPSSDAHAQLCNLKGKTEDDCQNYIRILFYTAPGKFLTCGTNSYKPLCRIYAQKNGNITVEKELEGVGLCPYNPEHNSTAVYSNGHLFSATVADFSGGDPLIYREPLRTELSDLKQLNAPNFVSSLTHGDYIYFFYRETAVEYMNCGKVIYSRVARVCKHDKGGPSGNSRKLWTTFLKARLNCSVPGEYPFYFDEIQSTSDVIEGKYGDEVERKIVYGALTTPTNAIGGSAICIFQMDDITKVFQGPFKHQETINSNWLPVPENKVPNPRPGECVRDSRILPDNNVNFIKTHSLMEEAVPSMFGKPILIKVSLHYRFTAVTVHPQVPVIGGSDTGQFFDVIYIGTDDGKVLKVVNIPNEDSAKAVVISENEVFQHGVPIKQLKLVPGYGKVLAVGTSQVKLVTLNHCANYNKCSECIELRDPHCAWDSKKNTCVSVDAVTSMRFLIQDVREGDGSKCTAQANDFVPKKIEKPTKEISSNSLDDEINEQNDALLNGVEIEDTDCNEVDSETGARGCAVQNRLNMYTSEYLHIIVATASLLGLFVGFLCGYLVSRRFHPPQQSNPPFIEQHNHLDRLNVNQNSFLTPRANKQVNLVLNVSANDTLPPKKDNLGSTKNLNITNEGTLQKIKKTYI